MTVQQALSKIMSQLQAMDSRLSNLENSSMPTLEGGMDDEVDDIPQQPVRRSRPRQVPHPDSVQVPQQQFTQQTKPNKVRYQRRPNGPKRLPPSPQVHIDHSNLDQFLPGNPHVQHRVDSPIVQQRQPQQYPPGTVFDQYGNPINLQPTQNGYMNPQNIIQPRQAQLVSCICCPNMVDEQGGGMVRIGDDGKPIGVCSQCILLSPQERQAMYSRRQKRMQPSQQVEQQYEEAYEEEDEEEYE